MNYEELKEKIVVGGKQLLEEKLVAGSWGNISLKVDERMMLVTPSAIPYESMTIEDVVPVNYLDDTYDYPVNPSSEFKLHSAIYRTRPEIQAVVHTHQQFASTVAVTRQDIPPILDDMAQIIGPSVRCAPYALPSSDEIVKVTLNALEGRMAALMANHGAVCLGRDLEEAFVVCRVLEKTARAFIDAESIGGAYPLSNKEAAAMHDHYMNVYSKIKK